MEHKGLTWKLKLPDGESIGGTKRLALPQDWTNLDIYFEEVKLQMLAAMQTQNRLDSK